MGMGWTWIRPMLLLHICLGAGQKERRLKHVETLLLMLVIVDS